jgi:hypothetical protein
MIDHAVPIKGLAHITFNDWISDPDPLIKKAGLENDSKIEGISLTYRHHSKQHDVYLALKRACGGEIRSAQYDETTLESEWMHLGGTKCVFFLRIRYTGGFKCTVPKPPKPECVWQGFEDSPNSVEQTE